MAKHRMPPRSASGRFMKRRHASNPRRRTRRAYRKNTYFANPVRRSRRSRAVARRNPVRRYHRRYRRNPPLFGGNRILGLSFTELAYTGIGFVAPPMIEGAVSGFLPDALKTSSIGKYAVKAGIVAGTSLIGSKFLGREAGKYLAIGGAVYLLANAIVEFAPQIFSGFSATTMVAGPTFRPALRGHGQPGLGSYFNGAAAVSQAGVPERLNIASRF